MSAELNRRSFLGLGVSSALLSPIVFGRSGDSLSDNATAVSATTFPQQDAKMVQEMVGASHTNLPKVKELLAQQPALAKASYDWGFGDWESALGAASHVGNRPIASVLLEAGARPSIFSAAMLGQLSVVRAFIDAAPGIQSCYGPHSITLLSHAKAGGPASQPVVDYLVSVGGADIAAPSVPFTAAEHAAYVGTYSFGADAADRLEIASAGESLTVQRVGYSKRTLKCVGKHEFRPPGGEMVRLRFEVSTGSATSLAVFAPGPIVTAQRLPG